MGGSDAISKSVREKSTVKRFPATIDFDMVLPYSGECLTHCAGITSDTAHLYHVSCRFDPPIPTVRGLASHHHTFFFFQVEEGGKFSGDRLSLSRLVTRRGRSDKGRAGYLTFAEGRNEDNYTPVVLLSVKEYCRLYIKPNYIRLRICGILDGAGARKQESKEDGGSI